jgi:hypothetical protein
MRRDMLKENWRMKDASWSAGRVKAAFTQDV